MSAPAPVAGRWTLAAVSLGLALAGALALTVVLLLAADGAWLPIAALGVVVAGGIALALARPSPLVRLVGVLLLQLTQLGGEAGTSVLEVVAGLALVGYLAHWYVVALASPRPLVRTVFDAAAVAWGTVGFAAACVLGVIFGADAYDFRADVLATLPFLFYLPVKDLCVRDERAGLAISGVLVAFGLVATLQNALLFRSAISGAAELYEIADARFNVGEISITAGLMAALASAALSREWRRTLVSVGLAGALLTGLIITKSRGFWVAGAFGIVAMAVVVPGRGRRRIVGYGALGVGVLVGLAVLLFRDQLVLVALGVLDRLVSIGSATTDISIVSRLAESAAVWGGIRENPVLGHGWGVQVTHYSVVSGGTQSWAFFHNGYLALWFKTGLWGLALMLTVWVGAMARAARAARRTALPSAVRAPALGAGAAVAAFTPVAVTSNPFAILDQMLIVTLVLALAHAMADRAQGAGR